MSDRFRSVALALRSYVSDTYALLEAADAVIALDAPAPSPTGSSLEIPHEVLVCAALGNEDVMQQVHAGKKINAIKELRGLGARTGLVSAVGLKAAKEAVEDERVWGRYLNLLNDPWRLTDEPPF
jgi:ribosomal protein L7/L12